MTRLELATFSLEGWRSTNWVTSAKATPPFGGIVRNMFRSTKSTFEVVNLLYSIFLKYQVDFWLKLLFVEFAHNPLNSSHIRLTTYLIQNSCLRKSLNYIRNTELLLTLCNLLPRSYNWTLEVMFVTELIHIDIVDVSIVLQSLHPFEAKNRCLELY